MTDAPWSTARVQVWHHKWLVGIIREYAPIAVDAYVLDADDLAVFRAQTSAATATEDTSLLSVRLPCRQLQGAPLRSRAALCSATARLAGENAECRADWRELEFLKVRGDRVRSLIEHNKVTKGDVGTVLGPCESTAADKADRILVDFGEEKGRDP